MNLFLPEVLAVRHVEENEHSAQFVIDLLVPPALAHFPGHFPGMPILPGVVQLDWAVRFAREHLAPNGKFTMMENIKFLALVLPDARVQLTLKRDAENTRIEFSYATSQRKCSSGRIVFGRHE